MDFNTSGYSTNDMPQELYRAELEARVNRLLELSIIHEEGTSKIIEALNTDNQGMRFELDNMRNDNEANCSHLEGISMKVIEDLRKELDKANDLTS